MDLRSVASYAAPMRDDASGAPFTLILLPGLDGTREPRVEFSRALLPAVDAQVVVYPTDLPLGYAQLEALVRERLPRDQPYILLGESFSGPIAIRIAARPPPGLCGVVLCGTFARKPFPWLAPLRAVVAWAPVKAMPRWLRALFMWSRGDAGATKPASERALAQVSGRVLRRRIADLLQIDVTRELAAIDLPMLILHATDDRVLPSSATRWLLEHARSAVRVPIRGPHLLLQARARQCAQPVADFIAGLVAQRAG